MFDLIYRDYISLDYVSQNESAFSLMLNPEDCNYAGFKLYYDRRGPTSYRIKFPYNGFGTFFMTQFADFRFSAFLSR